MGTAHCVPDVYGMIIACSCKTTTIGRPGNISYALTMPGIRKNVLFLANLLLLVFVPIRPVADSLDQYPINLVTVSRCIDPCSLHLSADGFGFDTKEFIPVIFIIDELVA